MVTRLVLHIGYDKAAAIAKKAYEIGKTAELIINLRRFVPAPTAVCRMRILGGSGNSKPL
jgi:aspartate ammonia-lyase